MSVTRIPWATHTWNPIVGCTHVSHGCDNCYALTYAWRVIRNPNPVIADPYKGITFRRADGEIDWQGNVRLAESRLNEPLEHPEIPRRYFVNSMGDIFHKDVPDEWIDQLFAVMREAPDNRFVLLTKRPERLAAYVNARDGCIADNVICGVSVEDQETANLRIPLLLSARIPYRLIAYEPMLGPVDFTSIAHDGIMQVDNGIHWIICGGESGWLARRCDIAWIRATIRQCRRLYIPCFVSLLGYRAFEMHTEGHGENRIEWAQPFRSRFMAGLKPRDWPEDIQVWEMPKILRRSRERKKFYFDD